MNKKIAVIGAGNVGAHIISYGIARNVAAEFLLVDMNEELEKAQVLDLKDSLLFSEKTRVSGVNFGDKKLQEADIFVITAGAKQRPGENRCQLLGRNLSILQNIAKSLGKIKPEAIVLLVTNPVDILTHFAAQVFDLPTNQILGTGTLLDSARLRWRLSEKNEINVKNMHGYILGEHGDSEFAAWSTVSPRMVQLNEAEQTEIETEVRKAAYTIIEGKGATYFGIGAATIKLTEAILHNTQEILPVSANLDGQYGLKSVAIGVPCIIGSQGVHKIVELKLPEQETQKLHQSAEKLKSLYNECEL